MPDSKVRLSYCFIWIFLYLFIGFEIISHI
jgi:hypothetical protein